MNHARDQITAENMSTFFRSDDTKSAVHAINKQRPVDVANFIAIDGIISNATTCEFCTVFRMQVSTLWRKKKENENLENVIGCMDVKVFNLRVSGMNQVKYAKIPDVMLSAPDQSHRRRV